MSSLSAASLRRPLLLPASDPVLLDIRAKLTAARQATQRPTVSYRAGQAPSWSQWRPPASPQHAELVQVEAEQASRHRAILSASPSTVSAVACPSRSLLSVPEPEDDSEDEHDGRIRQRRHTALPPPQPLPPLDSAHSHSSQQEQQRTHQEESSARDEQLNRGELAADESIEQQDEEEWSEDDSDDASSPSSPAQLPALFPSSLSSNRALAESRWTSALLWTTTSGADSKQTSSRHTGADSTVRSRCEQRWTERHSAPSRDSWQRSTE